MKQKAGKSSQSFIVIICCGLIYALLFGLPLYICCGLWTGIVFPLYNFTTEWVQDFLIFIGASVGVILVGAWLLGRSIARKTGNLNKGAGAGIWMGLVIFFLVWMINIVSMRWAIPAQRYPGNRVVGQLLIGIVSFFLPFVVVFGSMFCGLFGAYRFLGID